MELWDSPAHGRLKWTWSGGAESRHQTFNEPHTTAWRLRHLAVDSASRLGINPTKFWASCSICGHLIVDVLSLLARPDHNLPFFKLSLCDKVLISVLMEGNANVWGDSETSSHCSQSDHTVNVPYVPYQRINTEQQSRSGLQLTISTIISLWMNH